MSEESLLTDKVKAMIGKESELYTGYEIPEHEIREYCEAVDDLNPLYVDKEKAKKGPYGGIIAPPLFEMWPFSPVSRLSDLGKDGLPAPGKPPRPMNTPQVHVEKTTTRVFGGAEHEFYAPVRPGDRLSFKGKVANIYERVSSKGINMVFIVHEARFTNQKGELVAIRRTTEIER